MDKIQELNEIINHSKKIVFFGGAGVSTESGIPDFRSQDGLYHMHYKYLPETIISHSFFMQKPEEFWRFYRDKMMIEGAMPNPAHYKLAEIEKAGKLLAVVTQNIDGLHQKAGSQRVYELHGSTLRNYCMKCGAFYSFEDVKNAPEAVPRCSKCGGMIKPDVVLYEEALDERQINGAVASIAEADTLIIGGTSLVVYPAAGLIDYFKGDHLVVINKSTTSRDAFADLVINEPIGEVFSRIRLQDRA